MTHEQMTHGNKSTKLPDCINDLSAPMSIVKKFKIELKRRKSFYLNILCIS